jgi:hypothetical protein
MAGLLDLLFNPQAMGGGLLGQFVQQRRQDEPSPLDNAQWPQGPMGAPGGMDAMAQAPQMQPQQGFAGASGLDTSAMGQPQPNSQQPARPSYFESGMRGLRSSDSLIGGLLNFATGNDPMAGTNEALAKMGVPPGLAPLIAKNPAVIGALLQKQMGLTGQTDDIKEFEYAKQQGFKGTLEQWMQRKRAGAGEYGLQAIWGTDDKGDPAIIQLGKGGDAIQSRLPPGFRPNKDGQKVDLGTHWGILDPTTRSVVSTIPKDIKGKEAAEEEGKAQGQARVALPAALNQAEYSMNLIDDMLNHPGRSTATGLSGYLDPRNYIPGTDATNFSVRADQLKGRTFLQAFESLKGAGAITEVEGKKATDAIARLSKAQSDEEYVAALQELRGVIGKGVEVLKQKATGGKAPAPSAPSAPDPLGIR